MNEPFTETRSVAEEKKHKALRFEALMTGFSSRADQSLSFRGVTPELTTEEKIALMDLQNVLCEILLFPKDEKDVDVLEVRKEVVHKSPAQRMRSVIFLLWKQTGEEQPFEVFYINSMEKIIDHLKSKLPPLTF
jgi:hypothetical protein